MFTWRINGVGGEQLGLVVRGSMWRPGVSVRRRVLQIDGVHGVLPVGRPEFEAPKVTLVVSHAASSTWDLEVAARSLYNLVFQPRLTLSRVLAMPDGSEVIETAVATYETGSWGDFASLKAAKATLIFEIPGVFFRGPVEVSPTMPLGASTRLEVEHLAGSSGVITDPVLRIRGAMTNPQVVDVNSGTSVWWVGTVGASEYLYLDPEGMRAWKSADGSAWTGAGQDVSQAMGFGVDDELAFWPDADGKVVLDVMGISPSSSTLMVRAARAYL